MKVHPLRSNPAIYSCNAYLVTGDWKRIEDVNTLVDIGTDAYVLEEIGAIPTGIGKTPVEQVVLTHHHFDHAGGLGEIRERYNPVVRSWSDRLSGESAPLGDGEMIRLGDRECEVLHVPGHSQDSICIYCEAERFLFSGDTPVRVLSPGGSYTDRYLQAIERLAKLPIDVIYPGHDAPITGNVSEIIRTTLRNATAGN
ncbi:MAG TPA: MBL fold metallo-hydrolase [Candidatus Deferrimicrobiaceae bacterium]|jgi:glyoxylase-like metal-dependent hydrolase (beta-lactamase superfamily II)